MLSFSPLSFFLNFQKFSQITDGDDDQNVFIKPTNFEVQRKYDLNQKFELGKIIAKYKEEYDKQCETMSQKLVPARNKRQTTKPKNGYLSKAIREHYSDLKKLPSNDKDFRRALQLGKRSYEYYIKTQTTPECEPPSKKRYKIEGGGRKLVAEDVRVRLFQWFVGKLDKINSNLHNLGTKILVTSLIQAHQKVMIKIVHSSFR